jgi:FADH2 O2-dependent halogenase
MLVPLSPLDVDVAVIGSGFAGSLTALLLRSRRRRVALVERGRHPRFVIGESTTPLTNLLLEELADDYDLPHLRVFSKWGTWQAHRPDVGVGLKRGFTFLFHQLGKPFEPTPDRAHELMVAASPNDRVADTHWYRPDFDLALVDAARAAGVEYFDETRIEAVHPEAAGIRLAARRHGRTLDIRAAFVVDASGPRGFLVNALGDGGTAPRWMPPTQALYTHFTDVDLWESVMPPAGQPPYPPDAAALHHIFPGGWIWILRFNNGITSAGAALTDPLAAQLGIGNGGAAAWQRLLDLLPSPREQFRRSRAVLPFVHAPRVTFRTRTVVGPAWALLPSAAGVVDPLLSTGFPLTLLGIGRLVKILLETPAGPARDERLTGYAAVTQAELDATEHIVAALYASMADPALFRRLTLLYFAAASFSETVRRLGRPWLAPGFLLHAHPTFGPELAACCDAALQLPVGRARQVLFDRIARAIEPFDTAGLLDDRRCGWYPVLASDLIAGAERLQATREEIDRLLRLLNGDKETDAGQRAPARLT